ncbi:MAG TPA: hypothetical protein VK932_14505 [Kofleriaceae bacterium]|nr:hypothetical protein [Kofleriaceae bacterium]
MFRHRSTLLGSLFVVLSVAACRADDRRAAPPPQAGPLPRLASATQADLARELDDADQRGTWNEVKRRWEGQVLRWTVTRQRVLCATAEACNVAAFPIQRPAPAGWLPTLRFAPGQFAALEARCGGKELCEVTIEGKLEKLQVSGEQPTNLELTGVTVIDARG